MDYQKIVLVGTVISNPQSQDSKGNAFENVKFELLINSKDNKVVFPIVASDILGFMAINYIAEGSQILVEGKVEIDQMGKFSILANQIDFDSSSKEKGKKSKLLF